MKTNLLPVILVSLTVFLPVSAGEPASKEPSPKAGNSPTVEKTIKGWGTQVDPAGDCKFVAEGGKLTITVPGEGKPHDLSAELSSMTAPRVLQGLKGDFVIQVKVEGDFQPGDKSSQEGRTGYTGAGLVVFADERNFVRIERASIGAGGATHPYINFEIRVNGRLENIGTTGDFTIDPAKPVWLRLERKGDQILGAMSQDGEQWENGNPKQLRAEAWKKDEIMGGVAAISTSAKSFAPVYSGLSTGKDAIPAESGKEKVDGK